MLLNILIERVWEGFQSSDYQMGVLKLKDYIKSSYEKTFEEPCNTEKLFKNWVPEFQLTFTYIFFIFFSDVWSYLRKSHSWLDSDSEIEAFREDTLCLLDMYSWRFSLVPLILFIKSLAYSVA